CESPAPTARTFRQLLGISPGTGQLDQPSLELRRVRGMGLGHRELLFPRKGSGIHETGGTSQSIALRAPLAAASTPSRSAPVRTTARTFGPRPPTGRATRCF